MRPDPAPAAGPTAGPGGRATVDVDPALAWLLPAARRRGPLRTAVPDGATAGHLVQSLGVPLTEVGALLLDGVPVPPAARVPPGARLSVGPRPRPQPAPRDPPAFLLDVHLGALARRLRLLGLDAARPAADPGDAALVARAEAEDRVLLTADRGLARRRTPAAVALVRGADPDDQLEDVLDRFAPPLAPWTRCSACGQLLRPAALEEVAALVEPGTARTQGPFARCMGCGRVHWRGAHAARLEQLVERAQDVVARSRARSRTPDRARGGAAAAPRAPGGPGDPGRGRIGR